MQTQQEEENIISEVYGEEKKMLEFKDVRAKIFHSRNFLIFTAVR